VAAAVRGLAAEIAGGLPPMLAEAAVRFPEVFQGAPEAGRAVETPQPEPVLAGGRA
jgi:hypothetical protein